MLIHSWDAALEARTGALRQVLVAALLDPGTRVPVGEADPLFRPVAIHQPRWTGPRGCRSGSRHEGTSP